MGVLLATIVAIPDFSRSISLGVAELLVAGMLGVVTLVALTGRYRLVPRHALDDPISNLGPSGALPATAPGLAPDAAGAARDGVSTGTETDAAMNYFAPPDPTGR